MEEFHPGTRIVSGSGAVSALGTLGARRLFLVTDPYFAKNGTAEKIARASGAETVEIFDRVQPDPGVELAAAGTAVFQKFQPDLTVALGGGSALDLGTAIRYFAKSPIPLAAVPTTSGSGSEVTDFAILTHGTGKHPLVDRSLRPDLAILDSDLLATLPPSLIADTGFDVLTHAAEAAVGRNRGCFSDLYAREAFRTVYGNLLASFEGDARVRLPIHVASTMAGLAFTHAGLGLCHALSHSLGGRFHIPHGRLNAILLPSVIRYNARTAAPLYGELARAAGIPGSADTVAVRNLCNGLIRLRKNLRLPQTLAEAGAEPSEIRRGMGELVRTALADPCCKTHPTAPEEGAVRAILEEVTGHV